MAAPAKSAGHEPLRHWAELITNSFDDFELIAELAMALTGFAGVAAAFGGRDKVFSVFDRLRLAGVFLNCVGPLVGSLAFLIAMRSGHFEETSVVTAVAAILCLFVAACTALVAKRTLSASRSSADHDRQAVWIMIGGSICQVLLYVLATVRIGGTAMLLAGFLSQFLMGIWVFWRLLTRVESD